MKAILVLLAIVLLIVFHEFGHFIAGRIMKVSISEFSIGFGPLLFQRQGKRETKWSLRAVPLGGYCAFADENDAPGTLTLDKIHPLKRMFVFFAGPLMNFVTSIVLCFFVCAAIGVPVPTAIVDSVVAGFSAPVQEGDVIVSVNGTDIKDPSQIEALLKANAPDYVMEVERDGKKIEITGEMKLLDKKSATYDTGIIYKQTPIRLPLAASFKASFSLTGNFAKAMFDTLGGLFTGRLSIGSMSSLVGIINVVSNYAKPDQLSTLLMYLAYISVNLGIINLLPIPGLDGSHIIMDGVEAVTKKRVPDKVFYWAAITSFAALFALAFVLMIKDTFNALGM